MLISARWLSNYLHPKVGPDEIEAALIHSGFPIESRTPLPDGDVRLDVEITSNRGDALSHVGLAREVAAKLGLTLREPERASPPESHDVKAPVVIEASGACPKFTARVIRGVKVGPSPKWLSDSLEAIGQRAINNVVDVTNYINAELGNPCHAFDLAKLAGGALCVRAARAGETLRTLDGKTRTLAPEDIVVADAQRAQSLAGVMGGADSEVSPSTTDVVLEMATWDPVAVRRSARRHQLRTDASHRFERYVDARTLADAADRAAALIVQVAGGSLGPRVDAGVPEAPPTRVRFRPARCRATLGFEIENHDALGLLERVGVLPEPSGRAGDAMVCEVPAWRPDLTREIDLIEEVGRLRGLDAIPTHEAIPVRVRPPQAGELARREMAGVLTGLGFFECVTFSFCTHAEAALFMPEGATGLQVDDERRGGEPVLRPSVLSGLLGARRKNQHALARVPGGVRLFETASAFCQRGGREQESTNLALVMDVPVAGRAATSAELQHGLRLARGVVESLARALAGSTDALGVAPVAAAPCNAFDPRASAALTLAGMPAGWLGLLSPAALKAYDLAVPVVAAELPLCVWLGVNPPPTAVTALPAFPGTERDVSLIVPEATRWAEIERVVREEAKPPFESVAFVTTYRGPQVGAGRKSVTLRLSYRDPAKTLRREEADAPIEALVATLSQRMGGTVRA